VARGIAHTGRIITAAALIMSISFAALIAAQVTVMRMFGLGLTLAILVDATLVRMVLVPAFMHVMGQWIWWAPRWLVSVHRRLGFSDGQPRVAPETTAKNPTQIEPTGPAPRIQ
jgi:RND superfamily putative drug exporter